MRILLPFAVLVLNLSCGGRTELIASQEKSKDSHLNGENESTDINPDTEHEPVEPISNLQDQEEGSIEPVMVTASYLTCFLQTDKTTLFCEGDINRIDSLIFSDHLGNVEFVYATNEKGDLIITLSREIDSTSIGMQIAEASESPAFTAELNNLPADPSDQSEVSIVVSGADISSYQYKLIDRNSECSVGDYSTPISIETPISLTIEPGDYKLCVLGQGGDPLSVQEVPTTYEWRRGQYIVVDDSILVPMGGSLYLNASMSTPPIGNNITNYEWDLNNDNDFSDATGASILIDHDALLNSWGMNSPGQNTVKLKITDNEGGMYISSTNVELSVGPSFNGVSSSSDTWNLLNNWLGINSGTLPSGNSSALIQAGSYAQDNDQSTPTYNGGLVLEEGSTLRTGWTTDSTANSLGTSVIHLQADSELILRNVSNTYNLTNTLVIEGNSTLQFGQSTQDHHQTKTVSGEIRGNGLLNFYIVHGTNAVFSSTNRLFMGDFNAISGGTTRVICQSKLCFGNGNVTIGNAMSLKIEGGLVDAINDQSALILNGAIGKEESKLVLHSNETVGQLIVDGNTYPSGTYSSANSTLITGDGILTVLSGQ